MLVIDQDLMNCIDFDKPGLSEIYGNDVKWLLNEIDLGVQECKDYLPVKVPLPPNLCSSFATTQVFQQ